MMLQCHVEKMPPQTFRTRPDFAAASFVHFGLKPTSGAEAGQPAATGAPQLPQM
jgi:hypothetical protein